MSASCIYPENGRYSLQWIVPSLKPAEDARDAIMDLFPNSTDATVKDPSLPLPAGVLLHYNSGAALSLYLRKYNDTVPQIIGYGAFPRLVPGRPQAIG